MERFDKGEDYTAFWDDVLSGDSFNEEDIAEMQRFLEIQHKHRPLDNPRSYEIIGDFDDDLPF